MFVQSKSDVLDQKFVNICMVELHSNVLHIHEKKNSSMGKNTRQIGHE